MAGAPRADYSDGAMNSSNPSLRRVAIFATFLAAGNFAAFAQSSSATSADTDNSANSSMQNSNAQSGTNSNWSATTSSSNPSANSNYNSDASSHNNSASANYNADEQSEHEHSSKKLGWMDRRFVTKAAESGQDEIALAQLALEHATNPDVKQFAQHMIDDHTQANQQLMTIASEKNVKLDQDDATKDRTYRKLSKATGNDFDREFVSQMVDEHEKDVKLFEKESQHAKDPEVRQFASSTLPTLRQHLQQVQQLQQSIVPTGRDSDSKWHSNSSESNNSANSGMSGSSSTSNSSTNDAASSNSANSSAAGSSTSSTR